MPSSPKPSSRTPPEGFSTLQPVFSLYGRDDVELDVAFWADGDAGQCGNAGFHTVRLNSPVRLRLDMDNRPGGCRQMFRLRKLW